MSGIDEQGGKTLASSKEDNVTCWHRFTIVTCRVIFSTLRVCCVCPARHQLHFHEEQQTLLCLTNFSCRIFLKTLFSQLWANHSEGLTEEAITQICGQQKSCWDAASSGLGFEPFVAVVIEWVLTSLCESPLDKQIPPSSSLHPFLWLGQYCTEGIISKPTFARVCVCRLLTQVTNVWMSIRPGLLAKTSQQQFWLEIGYLISWFLNR